MEQELLQDLITYLQDDYSAEQKEILMLLIKNTIKSFKAYANYPSTFSQEKIQLDLEKNYPCIFDLIIYKNAKQGGEFEDSHSEGGTSRTWKNESQIYSFHGVVPFANI